MGELAKTFRVPLVTNLSIGVGDGLRIEALLELMSYMKNMVAEKFADGRLVARVRPPIEVIIDAGISGKTKGRGIFSWESNDTLYIVNDDTIYRTNFGTTVGTITSGWKKVHFTQVGTRLMMTDPQNAQAWTISSAHVLAQITSPNFPAAIAAGVVTLDGRAYVLDTSGVIYNSALEDPTTWSALEFIEAERAPDAGIYIDVHQDHIVVFGSKTIEFFYVDPNNVSGSPLSRRSDVFYNIGGVAGDGFWRFQDIIFFVGREHGGRAGIYKLENFQIEKISRPDLDAYISKLLLTSSSAATAGLLSGMQGLGKTMVLFTAVDLNGPDDYNDGFYTFAYDVDTGFWSIFSSDVADDTTILPLVQWTDASAQGAITMPLTRGILGNGDVIRITDTTNFGISDRASGVQVPIPIEVRTGWHDGGTNKYKYCRALELVANPADDITATISYSDTTNLSSEYTTGRTLPCTADTLKRKLTRLGRFIRRNWNISASVTDEVRLEALELEVALGDV